ncbi:MAG TPA: nucleotidyltransferase domain-containing protein, partial [Burkholderiaceae bacterium]|nr:nucleotidyltransferase domain-containing protein [Burkholderiaceae bacterium]
MNAAVLESPSAETAPATLPELRARFRDRKAGLLERFRASRPTVPAAGRMIRALGKHVDETLLMLWRHTGMPDDAVLLAVGGYGRGELFPHSDVDVLVLLPPGQGDANEALRSAIEGFITACWDIGLEIGSSVRTVDECIALAQADVTVQTALLESRYLCGSRRVFNTFRVANTGAMDPKAFLRAKTLEMVQRHRKYEDTPY